MRKRNYLDKIPEMGANGREGGRGYGVSVIRNILWGTTDVSNDFCGKVVVSLLTKDSHSCPPH